MKYPNIDDDLKPIFTDFTNKIFKGAKENKFAFPVYKLRVGSSDLQSGRQGGFRLIYLNFKSKIVLLMLIFSKTDQNDIKTNEVNKLNIALERFYELKCPFCFGDSPTNAKHFFINKQTKKAQITKKCPKFDENYKL